MRCFFFGFYVQLPSSWLAAPPSLTGFLGGFLLLFAWMRTAILAGGTAVVRSGVGHVEDGDEVLDIFLWRLDSGQTARGAKKRLRTQNRNLASVFDFTRLA